MDEFRRAYRQNDSDSVPLFEIAEIEASLEHFHKAIDVLREINGKFKDDEDVWVRAAFRLADIHQLHLNDISAARNLLRDVARRSPTSELGRMAHVRLSDMRAGDKNPNNPLGDDKSDAL